MEASCESRIYVWLVDILQFLFQNTVTQITGCWLCLVSQIYSLRISCEEDLNWAKILPSEQILPSTDRKQMPSVPLPRRPCFWRRCGSVSVSKSVAPFSSKAPNLYIILVATIRRIVVASVAIHNLGVQTVKWDSGDALFSGALT